MKMPTENIDTSMFAPCGMNCKVCYKHCYHKKPCAGCLNSDMGKPEHCRKCKIKDCVKDKKLYGGVYNTATQTEMIQSILRLFLRNMEEKRNGK